MSELERSTDGKTGMDVAKKYISGDRTEIRHGYSGKTDVHGSLMNGSREIYSEEQFEKIEPIRIQKSFPLNPGKPTFQEYPQEVRVDDDL